MGCKPQGLQIVLDILDCASICLDAVVFLVVFVIECQPPSYGDQRIVKRTLYSSSASVQESLRTESSQTSAWSRGIESIFGWGDGAVWFSVGLFLVL